MARYGRTLLFTAPQESISPTAAGMNITGIIWSRKLLAFFTAVTGRSFSSRHRNRITIPYAGRHWQGKQDVENFSPKGDGQNHPKLFQNFQGQDLL